MHRLDLTNSKSRALGELVYCAAESLNLVNAGHVVGATPDPVNGLGVDLRNASEKLHVLPLEGGA